MRILILAPSLPWPADDGGKLRIASVALALAAQHEVVFACFDDRDDAPARTAEFARRFHGFKLVPRRPRTRQSWLSALPSDVHAMSSPVMTAWVTDAVAGFAPDVLLTADPALTPYVAPFTDRVRVLDYLCVATLGLDRMRAIAPAIQRPLWAIRRLKFAAYLSRIARTYDACVVNSEEDRAAMLATSSDWRRVEFVPNGLDLATYPVGLATPEAATLIFHGSLTYAPNLDAVRHLAEDIMPRVRREVPEARLLVTGRLPADGSAPQAPGIVYTGYVSDIRPVIASAWACPVALRAGAGGARFKVLEALALGTPVVSTPIGVEGLRVTDGVDVLMADGTERFAAQVVTLLRSPELRRRLADGGRRLVERQYDWSVLARRFAEMLADLVARKSRLSSSPGVAEAGRRP